MRPIYLLLFCLVGSPIFAQSPNENLKEKVEDKNSSFYYPKLIERFNNSDSTLNQEDFKAIYYGGIYQSSYMPEIISAIESRISDCNALGKHIEAYELADSLLKEYPVSIQAYFEKAFACHNLKRFDEEKYNTKRYQVLIKTILKSGDGKSIASSWIANLPNDEFEVLKYLGFATKEETEIAAGNNIIDHFLLKPNKAKMRKAFFNVTVQNR